MKTKKAMADQFLAEAAFHCRLIEEGQYPVIHGGMLLDLDTTYGETVRWDECSNAERQQALIFALVWAAEMLLRGGRK